MSYGSYLAGLTSHCLHYSSSKTTASPGLKFAFCRGCFFSASLLLDSDSNPCQRMEPLRRRPATGMYRSIRAKLVTRPTSLLTSQTAGSAIEPFKRTGRSRRQSRCHSFLWRRATVHACPCSYQGGACAGRHVRKNGNTAPITVPSRQD